MAVQHDTDPLMDPWGAHFFSLEIGSETIAHFSECSGLKSTTEVFEIEEGGNLAYTHKRPGYAKWENIILKRGVSKGRKFEHWRDQYMYVPDSGWETRATESGAIVIRALDGTELRRYSFNQAWPVSWEGPSFAAGGSDLAIETLEIAHEGLVIEDTRRAQQTGPAGGHSGGRSEGPGSGGGSSELDTNEGPRFKAGLFGKNLTQSDPMSGEELIVEEHVDMLCSMRARIGAGEFPWEDVVLGDTCTASFGGDADVNFTGVVTAIRHFCKSGVDMIEIQALDPLVKLSSSRHTRFWEESTDSDVVSSVLGDAGVDTGTVDSTSLTHKYIMQRNESDLTFLRKLAARNGYQLLGNFEGKIDFKKPQFSGSTKEFERGVLHQFDYLVSHQYVPPSLTVNGWNYIDKALVEGTASSGDIEAIGGGANAVDETGTIWQAEVFVTDVWVADQGAAQDMAIAELNRLARSFVRGRAQVAGSGDIRPGVKIKFKDFATGFNPEAYIVGTRHRIQAGTYTTEFFFESNTKPA